MPYFFVGTGKLMYNFDGMLISLPHSAFRTSLQPKEKMAEAIFYGAAISFLPLF